MIITIRAGSSPVSRTKALKTLSFQGFSHRFNRQWTALFPILNLSLCIRLFARLKGANLMSRKKIKQVDAIRQKTLEKEISEVEAAEALRRGRPTYPIDAE